MNSPCYPYRIGFKFDRRWEMRVPKMGKVLLVLLLVSVSSFAQEEESFGQESQEPQSKFERFLFSKGRLWVVEYFNVLGVMENSVASGSSSVSFRVARIVDVGNQEYLLGLRVQVINTIDHRNRFGFMDADEAISLASALPGMREVLQDTSSGAVYRESRFAGGNVSLRIATRTREATKDESTGLVWSHRPGCAWAAGCPENADGEEEGFEIDVGSIAPATAFFGMERFEELVSIIDAAAKKIQELRQQPATSQGTEL